VLLGQLYSAATLRQCQFVTADVPTTHSGVSIYVTKKHENLSGYLRNVNN
jgi:hypothetical protein